jgi:deoxyadenosine/deoxycytidine kinase
VYVVRVSGRYIAVDGPIGVGKTTLVHLLAERLGARVVLELAEQNPFLADFYREPGRYAFQVQLFFLLSRYRQQEELRQLDIFRAATVADYLFAKDRLFARVNLEPDELALYERVYELLRPRILRPDLVVLLHARPDVLWKRVQRRGAEYEAGIGEGYLRRIADAYRDYYFRYDETPLLVVDTSDIDFVESAADREDLLSVIERTRSGITHYVPRPH